MSNKRHRSNTVLDARASRFAALGDKTRLLVVSKLSTGEALSISRLTADTNLTRQAVTKHLRILEDAGIVRSLHVGRESQFKLETKPIYDAQQYLEYISKQWDDALMRLKSFVED